MLQLDVKKNAGCAAKAGTPHKNNSNYRLFDKNLDIIVVRKGNSVVTSGFQCAELLAQFFGLGARTVTS